jgi:hypothetical protein
MVFLLSAAIPLGGQEPEWSLGGSVGATLLVGDASDFLAGNFGAGVHATRRWTPHLALRADASFLGLEETAPGERADNRLLGFTLGPELSARADAVGLFLRPFVGAVGNLRSGAGGAGSDGTDWTGAYGAAAGVRVFVGDVAFDVAGQVAQMGELEFARVSTFTGSDSREDLAALSLQVGVEVALR